MADRLGYSAAVRVPHAAALAAGLALTTAALAALVPPRIGFTHLARSFVLGAYGDRFVSRADFNGDGRDDVLIGGDNKNTLAKTPIYLLAGQGDGTFRDATSELVLGTIAATALLRAASSSQSAPRPRLACRLGRTRFRSTHRAAPRWPRPTSPAT